MRRTTTLIATVSLALSVAPAWGQADHDHEHHVVAIEHGKFSPAEVEVAVGEAVLWEHEDGDDPQSVTADDGSFDSHPDCSDSAPEKCMKGGDSFEHTFKQTGRFPYHSRTEDMHGVVIVVDNHDH